MKAASDRRCLELETWDGVHLGAVNCYCIDDDCNWLEKHRRRDGLLFPRVLHRAHTHRRPQPGAVFLKGIPVQPEGAPGWDGGCSPRCTAMPRGGDTPSSRSRPSRRGIILRTTAPTPFTGRWALPSWSASPPCGTRERTSAKQRLPTVSTLHAPPKGSWYSVCPAPAAAA